MHRTHILHAEGIQITLRQTGRNFADEELHPRYGVLWGKAPFVGIDSRPTLLGVRLYQRFVMTIADNIAAENYDQTARSRPESLRRDRLTRRQCLTQAPLDHLKHKETVGSVTDPREDACTSLSDKRRGGHATSVIRRSRLEIAAQGVIIKSANTVSGVREFLKLYKRRLSWIITHISPRAKK